MGQETRMALASCSNSAHLARDYVLAHFTFGNFSEALARHWTVLRLRGPHYLVAEWGKECEAVAEVGERCIREGLSSPGEPDLIARETASIRQTDMA